MIRYLTLLCALIVCSTSLLARHRSTVLNYAFQPAVDNGKPAFRIDLTFKGKEDDLDELEIPSAWGEAVNLEKGIKNLTKSARHGKVSVSYLLVRDWETPPARADHHAILEPYYFEFNTQNALVHPRLDPGDSVTVNFDWQKLPKGWALLTSFGTDERRQSFDGSWNDVLNAVFAGGDFRVLQKQVAGQPLTIAIRGKWRLTDEEMAGRIQKAIAIQRTFWKDTDFPYYLVTVSTFDGWGGGSGGSGFTNAFALYLQSSTSFGDDIQSLLAHEVFHTWNPYRMGAPGEGMTWFTEGFTRYYQDLLLVRAGMVPFPMYMERVNENVRKYEFSPAKNLSNQAAIERRSTDSAAAEMVDVRGSVAALWLDWKIRESTEGKSTLDNVMLDVVQQGSEKKPELNAERVLKAIGKYVDSSAQQQFRGFVESGASIEIPTGALGPCARLQTDEIPPFELGIDREALMARYVITGVKPDSEAFRAGLKDGQQVVGISIHWNDVSKLVKLTVRTPSGNKAITYYPRGTPPALIPQFHLTVEQGGTGQCIDGVWAAIPSP
jgi:predicted metalloprotease with PDZ domain